MRRTLLAALCLCVVLAGCKAKEALDKVSIAKELDKKGTTDLMKDVANDKYTPPTDGKLTDAQVQMYLKVREHEKQIAQVAREQLQQHGADAVSRPFLAISGTADTTAPIKMAEQAVNRFQGTRYLVAWEGGKHELRPEDVPDLFTWMVTFYNAYLQVPWDPNAMGRFIKMNTVMGAADDSMRIDVHVPRSPLLAGEALAVEFYNTNLGHYFQATEAGEIDNILKGGAGPGWELTGEAFKAWSRMPSDTLVTAVPVCRFYGTPGKGPNSPSRPRSRDGTW